MNLTGMLRYLPARNEVQHAYSDHTKVHQVFGTQPNTTLHEGLKKMIDWAKVAGPRKSTRFENIEITKNLPSIWTE
jgi:UDP-glucose 4-epimerase